MQLRIRPLCLILTLALSITGCASKIPPTEPPAAVEQAQVSALTRAIAGLADSVDPTEAKRAASLAFRYSRQLAQEYQVTDSALVHNLKVNLGLKQRGLCVHYTRDLLTRLRQEKFRSLEFHWAIANYEKAFRIEHSTAIISARGAPMQQGVVLDPWRYGGVLFWSPTLEDPEYHWKPQAEILALKKQIEAENGDRQFAR